MTKLKARINTNSYRSPYTCGNGYGMVERLEGTELEIRHIGRETNGLLGVVTMAGEPLWLKESEWKTIPTFSYSDREIPKRSWQTIDSEPNCPLTITNN